MAPKKETKEKKEKKKRHNFKKNKHNARKKNHNRQSSKHVDMSDLANIFQSIKAKQPKNKNKSPSKSSSSTTTKTKKPSAAKKEPVIPKVVKGGKFTYKMKRGLERKIKSNRQLKAMPNVLLMPKCSMCHHKMVLLRGDQAYEGFASVDCDYCGREDIHGEVWHCKRCANKVGENGFNLCRTCGYLISHQRHNEIRRVAPPTDDMGLFFNTSGARTRSTTLDGVNLYKHDEIKKTLKIGQ